MPRDPFAGTRIGPDGKRRKIDGSESEPDNPEIAEVIREIRRVTTALRGVRSRPTPVPQAERAQEPDES